MSRVVVIGGGPAGMSAAIAAAENGHHVTWLEKNEKLGKKLFITGKGRCNITNSSDLDVLFNSVMTNRKFLYSAFYAYDNQMVIDFFEQAGLPVKNERGNRIFPVSDHSSDVIAALQRVLKKDQVEIRLHSEVDTLLYEDSGEEGSKKVFGVRLSDGEKIQADDVIVATGGFSYQTTGSTGDGYRFAKEAGHTVTEIRPSLVPFNAKEDYVREMQGLSLKNVNVRIYRGKKVLYDEFGEMLFTHFGVSGPLILTASAMIRPDIKVNDITKEERLKFVRLIKAFPLTLNGLRDFNEAIITKGGVKVSEVNPSTMESKLVRHLYFCGEVLDLDAVTGGFNLQIAWSTGHLAGMCVE